MDAFAVAICKGLSMPKKPVPFGNKKAIIIGLYFGFFQALMPTIGYFLGIKFQAVVESVDHWFAFILLCGIGANMISEALKHEEENLNDKIDFKTMVGLSIATSIDALAIGVTFAFLKINILTTASLIGIITFIISTIGVIIGNIFGNKYGKKAEILGGVTLILIGIKILISHLI